MKSPTLGGEAETQGGGVAWQRDHRLDTANLTPDPHQPCAGTLREVLTAAADARRAGDHGVADQLEHDAAVLLRNQLRPAEVPA